MMRGIVLILAPVLMVAFSACQSNPTPVPTEEFNTTMVQAPEQPPEMIDTSSATTSEQKAAPVKAKKKKSKSKKAKRS